MNYAIQNRYCLATGDSLLGAWEVSCVIIHNQGENRLVRALRRVRSEGLRICKPGSE